MGHPVYVYMWIFIKDARLKYLGWISSIDDVTFNYVKYKCIYITLPNLFDSQTKCVTNKMTWNIVRPLSLSRFIFRGAKLKFATEEIVSVKQKNDTDVIIASMTIKTASRNYFCRTPVSSNDALFPVLCHVSPVITSYNKAIRVYIRRSHVVTNL